VRRVLDGEQPLIDYVQASLGYAMTGDVGEKAFFVLYGNGNNGKTTLLEAVRHALGDYSGQIPIESLLLKKFDGVSNDIAQLKGLRFVTSSEAEQGKKLAEAKVKQLTGMGAINARFMYQEFFEFQPTFKIFLDSNYKPEVRGRNEAIWSRIKLIPFRVSIPDHEKDKKLLEKLKAEAPGILAWLVRGCLKWQAHGLVEPPSVSGATAEYREEMDVFSDFVDECCELDEGRVATVADLYSGYKRWCGKEDETPFSKKTFGTRLAEIEGIQSMKHKGQRAWGGVGLRVQPENKAA
jgi:putative DNA primase/helicase